MVDDHKNDQVVKTHIDSLIYPKIKNYTQPFQFQEPIGAYLSC